MYGTKVYLCGPINGCTDAEAKDWREASKAWLLENNCEPFDPMVRDYRGQEGNPGIDQKIVEQDKKDIDECDALLVMYEKPSVGTSMEVLYAYDRGMAIHVVNASGKPMSPWMTYHASEIHDDLTSALEALNQIYPQHEEYLADCPDCGAKDALSMDEDCATCRACHRFFSADHNGGLAPDEYFYWEGRQEFRSRYATEIKALAEAIDRADRHNTASNQRLAERLVAKGYAMTEPTEWAKADL